MLHQLVSSSNSNSSTSRSIGQMIMIGVEPAGATNSNVSSDLLLSIVQLKKTPESAKEIYGGESSKVSGKRAASSLSISMETTLIQDQARKVTMVVKS